MPLRLHTEACASKMCKLQGFFGLFVFAKLLGIIFVIRHLIVVFFPHSTVSSSSSSNNKWTGTARKTRRRRRKRRRQSGMKRKMTPKTRKMEWSELPLIKKKEVKTIQASFSTGSFKFESTLTAQRKDGVEWVNPYSWSNFSYLIFFSKSQFFELFHVRMQEMELG